MSCFIKASMAILVFGAGVVFAGSMGANCGPQPVSVICDQAAWGFSMKALYLQPRLSSEGYYGFSSITPHEQVYNHLTNGWGWGFQLEGSYYFSSGNDLNLNWYHHTNSDKVVLPNSFTDPFGDQLVASGKASRSPRWDAANVEFGQQVDFGPFHPIRLHAGVQYARIKETGGFSAYGEPQSILSSPIALFGVGSGMLFTGFGPRVGVDVSHVWKSGIGVHVNTATSLLVGYTSFSHLVFSSTAALVQTGAETTIVPELEARSGITYIYPMAQSDLTIDLGWMWVNYFNSYREGQSHGQVIVSDFGLQGPYLGLKWVGSVA